MTFQANVELSRGQEGNVEEKRGQEELRWGTEGNTLT